MRLQRAARTLVLDRVVHGVADQRLSDGGLGRDDGEFRGLLGVPDEETLGVALVVAVVEDGDDGADVDALAVDHPVLGIRPLEELAVVFRDFLVLEH